MQVTSRREMLNYSEELRLASDQDISIEIAASRVSGTVTDASSSEALPGALVALRRLEAGEATFLVAIGTDSEGYFALPAISEGLYRMTVTKDGYAPSERQVAVNTAVNHGEMKIPLDRATGLDLDVRFTSGARPPYVTAAVLGPGGGIAVFENRPVDDSGRARFPTVPAGSWQLLAAAPRGALVSREVKVPGPPAPIVIADAGRLTVRVPALSTSELIATLTLLDGNGTTFRNLSAYGTVQTQWMLEGGKVVVEGVPEGSWSLSVTAPDGRSWTGRVTTAGVDAEVSLNQ